MRKIQLTFCAFILLYLTGAELNAQTMYLKTSAGLLTSIPFSNIEKIVYSNGSMIINESGGGTNQSISLSDIKLQSYIDWDLATGFKPFTKQSFELVLSPNPVRDLLSVNLQNRMIGDGKIEIIGTDGKLYQSKAATSELNVSRLKRGVYICRLIADDVVLFKKFIKQ